MGRVGRPPDRMSQLSAALTIYAWTVEHGRPPKACECKGSNGLHHWQTYYEIFGVNNFSGGILPMVSALVSGVGMRTCLGKTLQGKDCVRKFPDQGKHIRLCHECRLRLRRSNEEDGGEYSITMGIQRQTLREAGGSHAAWGEYDEWVYAIDWGGI